MPKFTPLIDVTGEVRELTAADMRRFQPANEVVPTTLPTKLQSATHRKH